MIDLQSLKLPHAHQAISFTLDRKLADTYGHVFELGNNKWPLTMSSGAFAGMFKLLHQFEVDWTRLLHVGQSFEYRQSFELPCPVHALSQLAKVRSRAGMHWLTFENLLWDAPMKNILIYAQSTILIQAGEA